MKSCMGWSHTLFLVEVLLIGGFIRRWLNVCILDGVQLLLHRHVDWRLVFAHVHVPAIAFASKGHITEGTKIMCRHQISQVTKWPYLQTPPPPTPTPLCVQENLLQLQSRNKRKMYWYVLDNCNGRTLWIVKQWLQSSSEYIFSAPLTLFSGWEECFLWRWCSRCPGFSQHSNGGRCACSYAGSPLGHHNDSTP